MPATQIVSSVHSSLGPAIAAAGRGDLAFSPLGIAAALALVRAGAAGRGADELDAVLGPLPPDGLDDALRAISEVVSGLDDPEAEREERRVSASLANALWPDRSTRIRPAYTERLASVGSGALHPVDFRGAPDEARMAIDRWVGEVTRGLITELFPASAINRSTRLVVANALYLAAPWADRFSDAPNPVPFTTVDGRTVDLPMFTGTGTWPVHEDDGHLTVTIPYVGGRAGFTIVVPAPGRFDDVAERFFAGEDAVGHGAAARSERVQVTWPGCRIDTELDLAEVLGAAGVEAVFTDASSLDGIVEVTDTDPGIVASAAIHRATVRADRHGTEAAAATALAMALAGMPMDPPRTVLVDRPFLFRIEVLDGGPVLFAGRVVDPAGA